MPANSAINSKMASLIPPEIQALFGDPPLLRPEDPDLYYSLLKQIVTFVKPKNIFEWLRVKDIAELNWEIRRFRRLKTLIIEQLRLINDDRRAELLSKYSVLEEIDEAEEAQKEQVRKEEAEIREHDAFFGEFDSALFLAQILPLYQRFDRILALKELRRDRVLRELESRRERFARRLRKASDGVIEGEFDEAPLAAG